MSVFSPTLQFVEGRQVLGASEGHREPPEGELGLGPGLTRGVFGLALVIVFLLSAGIPATYYVLESGALREAAAMYAHELSDRLQTLVAQAPPLGRPRASEYRRLLAEFLPQKGVAAIRVLDESGRSIETYEYAAETARAWWNRYFPVGFALVVWSDRTIGTVKVRVDAGGLFRGALALLLLSMAAGGGLALLLYAFPLKTVRRMADQIRDLQRSNAELGRRAGGSAELVETARAENTRLREDLERALDSLTAKNTELDSFVYTVSHDLKAPLVTIQGMSSVLLSDHGETLDAEGRHYLARIQANIQQMERLITDLTTLSRVGREARPAEAVDVAELVDDLLVELAEPIRARGINVIGRNLGTVWAIRSQMGQVIGNLLSNAVKYMGDSPAPTVEIGMVTGEESVECYVRDNGVGIDAAYHEKVFEIFQRLKEVEAVGTGVGLPIVKKIVEAAGGRIWVESAKGQGATFRFTWPTSAREASHAVA